MKLNEQNIIVTGSEGLLGKAVCNELESRGAQVIKIDINLEHEPASGRFKIDLTDFENLEKNILELTQCYPVINGLVNNAYPRTGDWGKKFEDITPDSWDKNVAWQMSSVLYLTQLIVKHSFRKNENVSRSIVNIGSIYGVVGPSFEVYEDTEMTMPAAYAAIKGGITNFTRYLASYLGPIGIRTNMVSPGGIFDGQNLQFVEKYKALTPLRRMGKPEDIAPSVAFLLSESAQYINGQNLVIDGGWTAR